MVDFRKKISIAICLILLVSGSCGYEKSVSGENNKNNYETVIITDNDIALPKIMKAKAVTFNNIKSKKTVYLDQALGFKGSDALGAIRKHFNKNWNDGLHYNGAKYYSLNSANVGININYNFKTNTQYKCRENPGYGYNCTGVCTSVLYYASKTKKSWGAYYKDLCNGQGIGRMCNGFYWWAYINKYNIKRFCAGRVSNADDVNKILKNNNALQVGYMVYFAPTVRGQDCHLGFYWGQDSNGNQMMRHCIWRGFEWSRAFPGARGTYDMYIIPFSHGKTGTETYTYNLKIKRKVKTKSVKVTENDPKENSETESLENTTESTTKNTTESTTKNTEEEKTSESDIENESESESEIESEI